MLNFTEYEIGTITSCGAAFGVIATFVNNVLSRKIVSRLLVPINYILVFISMAIFSIVLEIKYGALVLYFVYIFFSISL